MNDAEGSDCGDGDGRALFFVYTGQDASEIPGDVTHVRVDPSVKVISGSAFDGCERLESVELCEGLEIIDCRAFAGCIFLKRIEIPSTVKVINDSVFQDCDRLAQVELREGLERIEGSAFDNCKSLKFMKIPSTVRVIGESGFDGCDQLMGVELCEGLELIGPYAFARCKSLKGIKIPSTVKVIDERAFAYCDQLSAVHLYEGLERIQDSTFLNCKSLKFMKMPSTVRDIGDSGFHGCDQLTQVILCEGLEVLDCSAFACCRSLKRVKIPSTVKVISECAFENCHQLVHLELCEGLERIDGAAFSGCKSLKCIGIPSTVRVIGYAAFFNCAQLEELNTCEGLEKIGEFAFSDCKSLPHLIIPSSVKTIDDGAFRCCRKLASTELGEGLERIYQGTFQSCLSMKSIKIPLSVKVIDSRAFHSCQLLIGVEVSDVVKKIDVAAFRDCFSLRNVLIPPGAQALGCFGPGCHDLLEVFGSQQGIINRLKKRFDLLPIHKLCYNQSHQSSNVLLERLKSIVVYANMSSAMENTQDCLGMTPLHILACSTTHNIDVYRVIIAKQPNNLITEDKWGCIPFLYTIWVDAPREIVQVLIDSQKSAFPDFIINWDGMIETLCRSGASPEAVHALLKIHQSSFAHQSINWPKAAQELTIGCLVNCDSSEASSSCWESFSSCREVMMETLSATQVPGELIQTLYEIQHRFPDQACKNWKGVCSDFVGLLTDSCWLQGSAEPSLCMFRFLVKCNIPERVSAIGIKEWRMDIQNLVGNIPAIDIALLKPDFDSIHAKLISYEHDYDKLKDVAFLLELAVWKAKIRNSDQGEDQTTYMKEQYRINCGADMIIPNVLPFLIGN